MIRFPLSRVLRAAVGVAVAAFALAAQAQQPPTFYVIAHADDWQLFMGEHGFRQVESGNQTILIVTVAGDAGLRTGGTGLIPFFRAREESTIQSLQIPAATTGLSFVGTGWSDVTISRRKIARFRTRNVWIYFLRLPDGNPGGGGYQASGFQSLGRSYNGNIPRIDAIDGSARYNNWGELVTTMRSIVSLHRTDNRPFWVNAQDPDDAINPGDHSDHRHTGILAWESIRPMGASFRWFQDYAINTRPANLTRRDFINKTAMFGATASILAVNGYDPTFDEFHTSFLDRSYSREIP